MTTLIITLPESLPVPASLCQCAFTNDGQTVTRHSETSLSLLTLPAGADVVAVVPAQRLSWHRVELPRGTLDRKLFQESDAQRLRSVLDGLLEDRLLDDPAQLHFALEPHAKAGTPVWVSACDRAWLHAWVSALEQAHLPISRIVPEVAPPAEHEAETITLWVTGTPDDARLLASGPNGVTRMPLPDVANEPVMPHIARQSTEAVIADPAVAERAEQHFSGRVELQTPHQRAVLCTQTAWDLAQFDLLRNRRTRAIKHISALGNAMRSAPQWRAARWAAVALIIANLFGLQAWAWKEQSAQNAQRAAIRNLLTSTFPDVRVVVDAPLQMARALADLQRQSGAASSSDLETILGQFHSAAPESTAPSAIDFIAGEVTLKGLDSASPAVADVATRLQGQGYDARWDGDQLHIQQERRP